MALSALLAFPSLAFPLSPLLALFILIVYDQAGARSPLLSR
jgi:hypothetical protein